jgi:hypothetical protein
LKGQVVEEVVEIENQLCFTFSGKIKLKIDKREESYQCPEAMTLYKSNSPIVVWRYED